MKHARIPGLFRPNVAPKQPKVSACLQPELQSKSAANQRFFAASGRVAQLIEQRTENEPRVFRFSEVGPAGQMGDSPPFARLVSVEANFAAGLPRMLSAERRGRN